MKLHNGSLRDYCGETEAAHETELLEIYKKCKKTAVYTHC